MYEFMRKCENKLIHIFSRDCSCIPWEIFLDDLFQVIPWSISTIIIYGHSVGTISCPFYLFSVDICLTVCFLIMSVERA